MVTTSALGLAERSTPCHHVHRAAGTLAERATKTVMFCSKCGNALSGTEHYCTRCGEPVGKPVVGQPQLQPLPVYGVQAVLLAEQPPVAYAPDDFGPVGSLRCCTILLGLLGLLQLISVQGLLCLCTLCCDHTHCCDAW